MQIPIISGIYADDQPSIRTAFPKNLIPVIEQSGVSNGYLRPGDGIIEFSSADGPGVDRGGIDWNGVCYRVMGSKLVSINSAGDITTLGEVGNDGNAVSMDYSFDRLAVVSNQNLFYWDGTTLTEVTDADLGNPISVIFVDGRFMMTDGTNIIITELSDPTMIDPLKYGSAEIDPDPVKAMKKIRNEPAAVGRYTIEYFRNVAAAGFPWTRITGAQIQKGTYGTHTCCKFGDAIAFVGSGRHEQPSVYIGVNASAQRIANKEIDEILEAYTEAQLSASFVEARNDRGSMLLYIHLPDRTLIYDAKSSQEAGQAVWSVHSSALQGYSQYRARHFVYLYGKWLVGDTQSNKIGYFSDDIGSHWGETVGWEFGTPIIYNESRGVIFRELELVTLTGSVALGAEPTIATSSSRDGRTWSQNSTISAGLIGDRQRRLIWRKQGFMQDFRTQRFQGDSTAHLSFLRLEATLEPLNA